MIRCYSASDMVRKSKRKSQQSRDENRSMESILNDIQKKYVKKVSRIKDDYKKYNISEEKTQSTEGYIQVALVEAEKMWFQLQCILVTNEKKYFGLKDEEKIEMFKEDFGEFQNEFPIVSRYIICMGQYRKKAFIKYLKKCKNVIPDEKERKKNKDYMRNQWIERQADYVRYLWEEHQSGRINQKESRKIWQQAYNSLKGEFDEFTDSYEIAEKKLKKEERVHKREILYELVDRISTSQQSLGDQNALKLYNMLLKKKRKQNHTHMVRQINEQVQKIQPTYEGYGRNKELQRMFEQEKKMKEYKDKKRIGA